MSLSYARPHHGSTSEFQVSGFPFVTGSASGEATTSTPIKVVFPYVTQFVQVSNPDANGLYVGFTENGTKGTETKNRYYVPPTSAGPVIPVKCTEVFIMAAASTSSFTVIAGLTNVKDFPVMTGSDGFEGVG
tara:strand:+ start:2617 stop:3012 length:396 start_codon:yes stop_codon:yes gene_type:complete